MLSLVGISFFVSQLLSAIYNGIGRGQIDMFDPAMTERTVKNWIGFVNYMNVDCFAACLFSNLITMPTFMPVFKREYKSGFYSPHIFYFGNWLAKMMCLSFYPILMYAGLFHAIDPVDNSNENFKAFLKVAAAQAFNGVALGHMWSTVFDSETSTIVSGFMILNACNSGSGAIVNSGSNYFLAFLRFVSP